MHDAVHIEWKANTFASVCDVFDGWQTQWERERENEALAKNSAKTYAEVSIDDHVASTYFQSYSSVVLFWPDCAYSGTHLLPRSAVLNNRALSIEAFARKPGTTREHEEEFEVAQC